MIIYQVVDEENNLVSEHSHSEVAQHNEEDLTVWFADHYYHVEALTFQEPDDAYNQRSLEGVNNFAKWLNTRKAHISTTPNSLASIQQSH